MYKINIDIFQDVLHLYGPDELEKYRNDTGDFSVGSYGLCNGNSIWIGVESGIDIRTTIVHEASHYVDWLLEFRLESKFSSLDSSGELRAYILQFITGKIFKCLERGGVL